MRVSVSICTFNGERYLQKQLESLLQQTRQPDEVILRDDGSCDRTLEIARNVLNGAPFSVDIAIHSGTHGVAGNFQEALSACHGDIVFPCDQDDLWSPKKLEVCARIMEGSACDLLFHNAELIDSDGRKLPGTLWDKFGVRNRLQAIEAEPFPAALKRPYATGCCLAIRSGMLQRCLPIGAGWIHDEWLTSVASGLGGHVLPLSESLIAYRQHESQEVGIRSSGLKFRLSGALHAERQQYLDAVRKSDVLRKALQDGNAPATSLDAIREKIRHHELRAALGDQSFFKELSAILKEERCGNYMRYSWGNHGLFKDIFRLFRHHLAVRR